MGGIISSQIGAALTSWLGVTATNLDNFWKLGNYIMYVMLCCIMLYYVVLHYIMLHYIHMQ